MGINIKTSTTTAILHVKLSYKPSCLLRMLLVANTAQMKHCFDIQPIKNAVLCSREVRLGTIHNGTIWEARLQAFMQTQRHTKLSL